MNARAEAGNRAVVRFKNLGASSNPRPFEGEGLLLYLSKSRGGGQLYPMFQRPWARMGCMFIELCMVYVPLIHMYSVSYVHCAVCAGWRGGEQVVR